MTQTITAMFDNRVEADAAQVKLIAAGIPQSAIRLLPGATSTTSHTGSYDHRRDESGFWASLKDIFMPEEDRYAYTEGLSRGGTMLSVVTEDAKLDLVYDILEEHGSVNLDERETAWRKEGWSGYSANAAGGAAEVAGTASGASTRAAPAAGAAYAIGERDGVRGTGSVSATDKDYIPVVEEQLNVGKRVVDHGRVRIRSYVVEKPVEEQVSLRDETVHVDRRPVNRPVTAADEALFVERTIEAVERKEQVVVSKDARVVEEIGVRKDAVERIETVKDKVRRTEVEVEDERGNVSRTGTTTDTGDLPKR